MCYATPAQPEIITENTILRFTHSAWFQRFTLAQLEIFAGNNILHYNQTICTSWFQGSTPAQPEIFVRIWFYTTLEQPDFNYIRTTWFHCSTPTQPETVVDEIIVHCTHTALISLHSYNLISRFCTYTTRNLSWSNDILHPQIVLALSFLLCVYVFLHLSIFCTSIQEGSSKPFRVGLYPVHTYNKTSFNRIFSKHVFFEAVLT